MHQAWSKKGNDQRMLPSETSFEYGPDMGRDTKNSNGSMYGMLLTISKWSITSFRLGSGLLILFVFLICYEKSTAVVLEAIYVLIKFGHTFN